MISSSREKEAETERERKEGKRDSMQEQGNFVAPHSKAMVEHDAFSPRDIFLFARAQGRSSPDRQKERGSQRKPEGGGNAPKKKRKTIPTFFLVACCKVQRLFRTFRIVLSTHTLSTFRLRRIVPNDIDIDARIRAADEYRNL